MDAINGKETAFSGNAKLPEYVSYLNECKLNPQFFIELTSVCNFKCFYCNSPYSNRKFQMTDEIFYRILDQVPEVTRQAIRLHIDGEPMLHKKFHQYAKDINAIGYDVALASNGSLLDPAFLDIKMSVSINLSTSPEEFEKRSSIPFQRYIDTLSDYVNAWRKRPNRQRITFTIYSTQEERNNQECMENKYNFIERFVKKCGFEKPAIDKSSNQIFIHRKENGPLLQIGQGNVTSGGLYPNTDNRDLSAKLDRDFGFCDSPWKRLAVLANGQVVYCCIDLDGSLAYTKPEELFNTPLKEIWLHDERIERLRHQLLAGRAKHKACQVCLDRLPTREFYTRFQPAFVNNRTGK